jgi:hypothetical protein
MAARSIGSMYAELTLRDKMSKGIKSAVASLKSFGTASLKYGAVAGAAVTAAMIAGTKRALSQGAALEHLSQQTGVLSGNLAILQRAYKDSGLSADAVGQDINKLQRNIADAASGNVTAAAKFSRLGLAVEELQKLKPEDQFQAIGAAIMAIEDPAERAAAAMDIFGRGRGALQRVFGSGLANAEKSLGRMPEIANRFAGAMERADTLLGRMPAKSDAFFMGFTSGIVGQILPHLERVDEFDFTTLGENLGIAIGKGMEMITSGKAWQLFELHAEKAYNRIMTLGNDSGLSLTGEITNVWAAGINTLIKAFQKRDPSIQGEGESFPWAKVFDAYAQAGVDATMEIGSDIDDRIREIMDDISDAVEFKRRRAEAFNPDWMVGPPIAAMNKAIEELDLESIVTNASFSAASIANEYQRRGLSLDANGAGNVMKSTEQSVSKILDLLVRNFRITREPVF